MKTDAVCYLISSEDGQEHATIYMREGKNEGGANTWGSISILSTYGNFGHYWGYCGNTSFAEFLSSLNFDYAMKKLKGNIDVFDFDKSIKYLKERVVAERRDGGSHDRCREAFDAIQSIEDEGFMSRELFSVEVIDKLRDCLDWSIFGESCQYSYDPQCLGFWEKIWKVFIKELNKNKNEQTMGWEDKFEKKFRGLEVLHVNVDVIKDFVSETVKEKNK
jgi:hypothetical protein